MVRSFSFPMQDAIAPLWNVARGHFLVLLTPSALERCDEPNDWLRREIETALSYKRNIVPLTLEGFDFSMPEFVQRLTGTLAPLKHYNGLTIPPAFFDEAMERLRRQYLTTPLSAILHPVSSSILRLSHIALGDRGDER